MVNLLKLERVLILYFFHNNFEACMNMNMNYNYDVLLYSVHYYTVQCTAYTNLLFGVSSVGNQQDVIYEE